MICLPLYKTHMHFSYRDLYHQLLFLSNSKDEEFNVPLYLSHCSVLFFLNVINYIIVISSIALRFCSFNHNSYVCCRLIPRVRVRIHCSSVLFCLANPLKISSRDVHAAIFSGIFFSLYLNKICWV